MPTLIELLEAIWHTPNSQMTWGRIERNHVVGAKPATVFQNKNDYVIVNLASMFLKNSRVLWLKLSPLAHATVTLDGLKAPQSQAAVIGPAQFGDLAAAPTDRSVILRQRLAGPSVWRGGDLRVALGLFAVPKDEAATALLDTVGQLAGLAIPGLKQAAEIARVCKSSVEGLIGLKGTKPVLGVKVGLGDPLAVAPDLAAAPCTLVAIAAPQSEVDLKTLWVRDGRLWEGHSAQGLSIYERNDYLLVEIERGPPREDWRGLPSLTPHESEFDTVLRAKDFTRESAVARLNEIYVAFDADLVAEPDLTDPDKERIRGEVIAELQKRLQARLGGGPFGKELRSVVAGIQRLVDPQGFNFLDVGDSTLEGARPAKAGLRPF